jgi:hypothetical protein
MEPGTRGRTMTDVSSGSGTQAVDRAAQLVSTVVHADAPLTFADLQEASGLAKSTTSRMLAALERTGLADGDEFMMMVESAARQLNGEVDLMQVKAGILSEQSASKASAEVRKKLETEFNEIVAENAYDNIATQPQPGEYLLLKDRAKPAAEVMDKLSAAAQRMSIAPADLGLAAKTVAMESLDGDFSQANINGIVFDLRQDPSKPIKQWELEPEPKSWIKPVIRGAAAALGIKPSKTGR